MRRAPELDKILRELAVKSFGWNGCDAYCRTCNAPLLGFRDELSWVEAEISGMCQECQDEHFGNGEDDE